MFEEEGGAGKVAQRYLLFKLTVSSDHQYLTNVLLENFLELGGGSGVGSRVDLVNWLS